jgi:uncharacterized protein YukE
MSSVQIDADELEDFIKRMQNFECEVGDALGFLRSRFHDLTFNWDDQKRYDFEEEFEEMTRNVQEALSNIHDRQLPRLREIARIIEEYHDA